MGWLDWFTNVPIFWKPKPVIPKSIGTLERNVNFISSYLAPLSHQLWFEQFDRPWLTKEFLYSQTKATGATHIVTIEFLGKTINDITETDIRKYMEHAKQYPDGTIFRPLHEVNGSGWYSWQTKDYKKFKEVWSTIYKVIKETNPFFKVALALNNDPNNYWAYADGVSLDMIGLDGYQWSAESGFAVFDFFFMLNKYKVPKWIFETAAEINQAQFCKDLMKLDVSGIVYFNTDKERKWALR